MNRTDRLYAIVEELRAAAPRSRTTQELSERYEVSVRTVERDISALRQAGVPIYATRGRRGGYALDEAEALAAMPARDLAAATELIERVRLLQGECAPVALRLPPAAVIKDAVADRLVLRIEYSDRHGAVSRRAVEPVAFVGNGPHWYLIAWCRLRGEARAFRTDRILRALATGERAGARHFEDVVPRIPDLVARMPPLG